MSPTQPIPPFPVLHQFRGYRNSHRSTLSRGSSRNYEAPEATLTFLADGQLKFVAALPERFAEFDPSRPFVAKIEVKPFGEQTQP